MDFKLGAKCVKNGAIAVEVVDRDGKRIGSLKIRAAAPDVIAGIVAAARIRIEGGVADE